MYKKILVPLDGSTLAECALSHVISLVKYGGGGEVILLRVVDASIPGDGDLPDIVDITAFREKLFKESEKYLSGIEARLTIEGVNVRKESLESRHPSYAISEYARQNSIDLIVIATHGYTGLRKMMFGSVALGVLHESHIPVLLIRPESCRT